MNVLEEILAWSQERPPWQRDALRRLLFRIELTDDDIIALTEICKSAHGLAEQQPVTPLAKGDLPSTATGTDQVTLLSIFHLRGVNALAENQSLKFAPNLTVVYGDNGAGKTGYIRILKTACRARGTEEILGNVVSGTAPPKPAVSIKYAVASDQNPREWTGETSSDPIGRVSVFDSHSAAVYLREKTDVAFRPFGLDLFDGLVRACKAVRTRLETQQRAIGSGGPLPFQVPEGTAVAKLLAGLSSLTDPQRVRLLAQLSEPEKARLQLLEAKLLDLQANDPGKLAQQLSLRSRRLAWLSRHLREMEAALSDQSLAAIFAAKRDAAIKDERAKALRETTFPANLLAGTGSDEWARMWNAAREFSRKQAYPHHAFPFTEDDARCVLCQQDLEESARERLRHFESFVGSTAERELNEARELYQRLSKAVEDLPLVNDTVIGALEEIRIEHPLLADQLAEHLAVLEQRRASIFEALRAGANHPPELPAVISMVDAVAEIAAQLTDRAAALQASANEVQKRAIIAELNELKAREILAKNEQSVLDEIERKKRVAAFGLCINETKTQTITAKSTAVTRATVTEKLTRSFRDELASMRFKHIEVEMKEVGGDLGNLYHKIILKRAPGIEVPKVVSEGEARCLSIAAFFAELSTADDASGIVFDDPVSSLDYKWRENVASRLVAEARTRQVIVFTHDVVFLLHLHQFAKDYGVQHLDQHVRQLSKGAGVCTEELPWVAMPVKKRIGHLRNEWQWVDKLSRDGHQAAYEKEAAYLYGLLREAWERGLEEVLLGGVVERYRPGVQTQQIARIADITEADCKALEIGMTKCSRWLPGHDQAPAAKADMPDPQELKADIDALDGWVSAINQRRSGRRAESLAAPAASRRAG